MDYCKYRIQLPKNLMVPKPHYSESPRLQILRTGAVLLNLRGMLSAIQLHDEPTFMADKINYVLANGVLPSKLESSQPPISQTVPDQFLGIRLVSSQVPGVVLQVFPSPRPSPSGRGRRRCPCMPALLGKQAWRHLDAYSTAVCHPAVSGKRFRVHHFQMFRCGGAQCRNISGIETDTRHSAEPVGKNAQ